MKANPIASGEPTFAGAPSYGIVDTLRTLKVLPLRVTKACSGCRGLPIRKCP